MSPGYTRVTAASRCEICDGDSWCWVSPDGLARGCMRSDGAPFGDINPKRQTDEHGVEYWLYMSTESRNVAVPTVGSSTNAAEPDVRYDVYRQLIKRLQADRSPIRRWLLQRTLAPEVAEQLLNEGVAILDRGKPAIVKDMIDHGLESKLAGTPGFYIDDRYGQQVWNIAGRGVLVPCRDLEARIIAAQLRRLDEDTNGPKYYWLSSASKGGASPASPIHIPRFTGDSKVIRVTEGLLKSEIATRMSGIRTLGIAGTGWHELNSIVPKLQPREVLIAYDADFETNPHILHAIRSIATAAKKWSCAVFIETWPREHGKGIDDVLLAGHQTKLIPAAEFLKQTATAQPRTTVTLFDAVQDHLTRLSERADIIRTGLTELDSHIGGGLEFGEMMIFGARPNHGKTAVGQQLLYAFSEQRLPGLFVSLEMSADRVGKRAIQHITATHQERWREQRSEIVGKAGVFLNDKRSPVYIDDASRSLAEIQKQIVQHVEQYDVKAVLIDYAQLIDAPGRSEYEKVSEASKRIAHLTSELGIITVLLSQVGRQYEQRGHAKRKPSECASLPAIPSMSELKSSGQLEQDASVIVFGVHPCKYDTSQRRELYLMQAPKVKNRESDERPFLVEFNPSRMMFSDKSPARVEAFDSWNWGTESF